MKNTSTIESYLDGSMSSEQRIEFVKRMADDPNLAHEVEFFSEVNSAILENDVHYFREGLKGIIRRNSPGKKKLYVSWIKFSVAAGILILIAVSVWQIVFTYTAPELYANYYSPYESDVLVRSADISADKTQLSYLLYQQGDFEASFGILENYLEENYNNPTARFYFGMNAMELGLNELAIDNLAQIEADPSTPFSLHARWYVSLLYLKTNQAEKAITHLTILSSSENLYTSQSKDLLKKL